MLALAADHVALALERARLVAELRGADAREDEFLAILGHELRNPLAPVLNTVKLVQRREGSDPVLQRALSAVHVLIYFRPPVQERACAVFQHSLAPGGVLGMGLHEALPQALPRSWFEELDGVHKLYRRRS